MKATITVHQTSYDSKPSDFQCSEIRKIEQNKVIEVSTYDLAGIVANKQSIYLGIHNLSGENGYVTTSEHTFISQSLFALDLDHGNFTLEQIIERLNDVSLPPNLIYKTFGYQEPHQRRWRIIWFSNRPYSNKEDIRRIQEYLIYVMGHDFKEYGNEWIRHLDTSGKDIARILFGGIEISHLNNYVSTDFNFIFDQSIEKKVNDFFRDLSDAKRKLRELEKGDGGNPSTPEEEKSLRDRLNRSEPLIIPEANDMSALAQKIIQKLELLAKVLPNKPHSVDYYERYEFINQLPLDMLLGVELYQKFNCVLPGHVDQDPSAHIILSKDGKQQQVYRCFGCMETHHAHRTFNVISAIFEAAFGYTYQTTLESIYTLLKVKLGSEYQRQAHAQIESDIEFLEQLGKDHALNKKLRMKRIKGFYKIFLMLAKSKVSYECMLKEEQSTALVFFAANSFIQQYAKEEWSLPLSMTSVNRKINYLVKLGLIDKVEYRDLSPMLLKKMEKFIEQTKAREAAVMQTNYSHSSSTRSLYRRNPDYYRVNYLTPSVIDGAVQIIELDKKVVARSKGQGAKQLKAAYGVEKSKQVHPQSSMKYTKDEERFLKMAKAQVPELLKKGYFTESELITRVDSKGKYWKKAEKEYLSQKLLPELVGEFNLEKKRVSKVLRAQLKVPEKITSYHHILFQSS